VKEDPKSLKLLIDEDLSPRIAQILCQENLIDAVPIRDRKVRFPMRNQVPQPTARAKLYGSHLNFCGALDHEVLELAFNEDRILVTANIKDFEKFARLREVHCSLIFLLDGDLRRCEQLAAIREAICEIRLMDITNCALYVNWREKEYELVDLPSS
jgi:predicted nuclease of predicted toxin-antitoxin system